MQFYEKRSGGGKGASAQQLQKAAVESAKQSEKGTKVSERTFRGLLGEQKKYKVGGTFFSTPDSHKLPKHVRDIDNFDEHVIWCTVHEFYLQKEKFRNSGDRVNFKGSRHILWRIVKGLGFQSFRGSRMVHIEKFDMRYMQVSYLTAL